MALYVMNSNFKLKEKSCSKKYPKIVTKSHVIFLCWEILLPQAFLTLLV